MSAARAFPSPCGVWVVSTMPKVLVDFAKVSVPLRGVGCFHYNEANECDRVFPSPCGVWVVSRKLMNGKTANGFRPLAGCGLFPINRTREFMTERFRPLAGCGLFLYCQQNMEQASAFPSPCGVWVVSAKLHILSGATGKRIVNSAILLYHIGRCLSIAN